MAVVSVGNLWERRRSSFRDSVLTHYLMYQVICDNANDGTAMAVGASGIPEPGSAFVDAYGNVAYLSGIDCDPKQGSEKVFEVQVEFTTPDPSQPDDNPLHQPSGFSWSYENTTEGYFVDNSTGNDTNALGQTGPFIVATSAGEAFEQLPVRDKGWLVINMTRNEASHDAAADDQYSNTTNMNQVLLDNTTYAVGTLKMSPITATKNTKTLRTGESITYYAKVFQFKARHEGWNEIVNDVGFSESVGVVTTNTQQLRRIVDGSGSPISKPWPLDGKGKKKPNPTDLPASLTFKPYLAMDWSPLNFT